MILTTLTAILLSLPQTADKTAIPGTNFGFEVVRVEGGKDLQPYWMARTEVTMEAFLEFFQRRERVKVDGVTRPSAPYEPPNGDMGAGKFPACGMRWHGAATYCLWLSKVTGQKFRLPTDLEWEQAAGGPPAVLEAAAWFAGNANKKTHEVGTKAANAFGLHDMLGNVWEYSLESFTPGEYGPVLRGGAWNTPEGELKASVRQPILPAWYERDPNRPRSLWWLTDARFVGFRVLRVGSAADQEPQKAYASKVAVKITGKAESEKGFIPVSGEITNTGERTLSEVELTVFPLTSEGKPLFEDEKARATFMLAYPVLTHAFHPGEHKAPLKPGESRKFSVLVPEAYEIDEAPTTFSATVSGLRFAD